MSHVILSELMKVCLKSTKVPYSIFDKLIGRSYSEKLLVDCHYKCSVAMGVNNIKLEGRYPFFRILFCTEFFSTLFSAFNLIVHLVCFNTMIKKNIRKSKIGNLLYTQHVIICSCWIFSMFFHIQDTKITRYLDYFFAFLFLVFAFYLNLVRSKLLIQSRKLNLRNIRYLLTLYYILHVFYMVYIDFNYSYSKIASGCLFALSVFLWTFQYFSLRRLKYSKYILFYMIGVVMGAMFEIYDMPPLFYLVDSHALWHLFTAILAPLYYLYIKDDMLYGCCLIK